MKSHKNLDEAIAKLEQEIAYFDEIKQDIYDKYLGKWVVIYDQKVFGAFDSFREADRAIEPVATTSYFLEEVTYKSADKVPEVLYCH